MRLTTLCIAIGALAVLPTPSAIAQVGAPAHGIAMHGEPMRGPGEPMAFADPEAPTGGTLSRANVGSFDSLNPYIVLGSAGAGVDEYHFARLMERSWDEPFTLYASIAETVETAPDRSWVEFTLNPAAEWHDGTRITVDDVVFSFETFRDEGTPSRRRAHGTVAEVRRIGDDGIRFTFDGTHDQETAMLFAMMPIISRAYYSEQPFDETSLEIPLGAGPYRLVEVDAGRRLVYERVADWWGADLPAFAGQMNFDRLVYDYYRDGTAALAAFEAGDVNYRLEFSADRWDTAYDFPAVNDGRVTLFETRHGRPGGMRSFAFNTRRAPFDDIRVRQALNWAFDFEWVNRTYFRDLNRRTQSFFSNTDMAATGLPEGEELALLEPFRADLPESVFTWAPSQPETDGSGNNRGNLREANRLLEEAGWTVVDGVRVDAETGDPLRFEILVSSSGNERLAVALQSNLDRLGVTVDIRLVDSSQYQARIETFDFDMIVHWWRASLSPGSEQYTFWGSESADTEGTRNYAGVRNPVVDSLAQTLANAPDRVSLETAARALDRVLLNGWYVIPLYYNDLDRIAYWGDMGYVDYEPLYGMIATVNGWWSNP